MDDLTRTRREEAIAFFRVNQEARTALERVVAIFVSVSAIATSIGVATESADVAMPLAPLLLLLLSYMFQQYADLTTIGIARRRLEDLVNERIDGKGLIYETAVAQIRQLPPLVNSVRFSQALLGLIILAVVGTATYVAVTESHGALAVAAFAGSTVLAGISAAWSYTHMLRSRSLTADKLAEQGLKDVQLVWIPSDLYQEARANSARGEPERETFARLLRAGLEHG